MPRWLNVGCGPQGSGLRPPGFQSPAGLAPTEDRLFCRSLPASDGPQTTKVQSPAGLAPTGEGDGWTEVRLDADPAVQPDILAPAHDLSALEDGCMDAVFSSHCIEHLYLDQAVPALREWRRVLRPDGFLLLVCPDLQAAAEMVVQDRLFDVAYAGIRPYDIIFSHEGLVAQGRAQGHSFMEHKSGYTLSTLRQLVSEAGFAVHAGMRLRQRFELWLIASVQERSEPEMRALAQQHFLWPTR